MIIQECQYKYSSDRNKTKNKRIIMKKMFFTLCASTILFTACNATNQGELDKQDSIQEAAAADSMLKSAIEADSLNKDTVTADSIK